MEIKYKIIKKVDVDDNITVIFAKKVHQEEHKCKDCIDYQYIPSLDIGVCKRYKGAVSPSDKCIEIGM